MTGERFEQAPRLSERLAALVDMVPPCDCAADIGADHGYTSARLLALDRCRRVWVADISDKALARAKANLTRLGFADRARFVCGDGFHALAEPVDAALIAGMGARTIVDILDDGVNILERLNHPILVISPNRDPELVRYWLDAHGYSVVVERVVRSDGRWYPIIRAEYSGNALNPSDRRALYLGLTAVQPLSDDARAYWAWRLGVLTEMLPGVGKVAKDQRQALFDQIAWIKEVLGIPD
ncbi:hypothetical protein AGMMS49992_07870 [Clostridia bacterium]|nr:hypothetical protein AGMMS49992_07870 [Clostridia bacterium]